MRTRRNFLHRAALGTLTLGFDSSIIEKEEDAFPDYPGIPGSVKSRLGWERTDRWQIEKENAKWSIATYEWYWLRELIRKKTDGIVDIPLGGLIAFHIGDNEKTWKINGRKVKDGGRFTSSRKAKWDLEDPIENTYKSFLDDLPKQGFKTEGSLDWSFSPIFPSIVGFWSNKCKPSGTLTTEQSGSVQLTQFNLEYPIKTHTANLHREVDIEEEADLECFGWIAGWSHNGHIFAVGAVHPRSTGDYCGYDNPHLEEILSKVTGDDVSLELEKSLYGRVHSMMGAVE